MLGSLTKRAILTLLISGFLAGHLLAASGPPTPGPSQQPPPQFVPKAKPDLIVEIQQVFCSIQDGNHNVQVKLRVQNASNNATWKEIWTQVLLDSPDPSLGMPFMATPYAVPPPLFGGQGNVKHKNVLTTPGPHTIFVKTDWSGQQPETNERNNTAVKKIIVPTGPNGC